MSRLYFLLFIMTLILQYYRKFLIALPKIDPLLSAKLFQATEDTEVRAHRVILSACSPHLRDLLKRHSNSSNPNLVIYLRGVQKSDLDVS